METIIEKAYEIDFAFTNELIAGTNPGYIMAGIGIAVRSCKYSEKLPEFGVFVPIRG